ncbi:MAG: hypothetical protein ACQPRI_04730 [Solitalea-like symbiont of Tyrophagus putrescentiae]
MQNKMGIILTPKTTYTKSILIVVIFFIALLLVVFTATLHSQETPSVKSEGIALSVDVPGGDKGIILPKIELTDLSQYSPIKGQEREGLIIENTHIDSSKGLSRGLYMWHEGRWDKLLTYRDVPEISGGTRVYTGIEDPNQSSLPEIVNAPNGSIYINKTTKIIFKKTDKNWTNELSIQGTSYIGSSTIAIKDDTSGAHLEAIAGAGIKLTEQGIAASIDTTTLTINQQGINAKNSEALWNANKLQGTILSNTTPSQGQTLRYDTSKKSWVPGNIKELPDGASEGQLLVWTGSVWSPQVSQKVDIKGNDIHFSGLTGYPPNGAYRDLLVIDSNGKVQRSFGNLWDLSGNKDPIGSGNDHILGFTDTTSTSNIVFKTKNAERIRISSDGKVDIKTPNAYLSGLSGSSSQNTASDYILMTDNSGKLKRWSGTVWDASGNSNITSGNKILGFTDTTSTANIVFRTKNTDRLSISSDGKVTITSSDVNIPNVISSADPNYNSTLMVNSVGNIKKLTGTPWLMTGNSIASGDQILGFTNTASTSNIVFKTKNAERMRIGNDGKIHISSKDVFFKGVYSNAAIEQGDTWSVLMGKDGKLHLWKGTLLDNSKVPGKSIAVGSDSKIVYLKKSDLNVNKFTYNNYNGTELKGSDGEITVHMVLLDNSIESAKKRYGTVVIKVGYDYTANIDPTIVYAYDVRDRRNLVSSNTETEIVQVKTPSGIDYDIYFAVLKYANKYRLVPKVKLKKALVGNEDKTVLVIRSTTSINH